MSEFQKVIISFVLLILLCIGCFFGGYLLSNRRATEQLNQANRELREQQQRYELIISSTTEQLANIRKQLQEKVNDNGATTKELRSIIEQIKRQRIDL